MRPLRPFVVAAAAATVISGLLTAPASASDGGRIAGYVGAGPVPADTGGVTAPVSEDAHPVTPEVEIVSLEDATVVQDPAPLDQQSVTGSEPGATIAETDDGAASAVLSAATPELAVIGVSWAHETAPEDLELSWRTMTDGVWSDWETVPAEHDHGEDAEPVSAEARDGTDPLVAIDATAVEVLMASATGALPTDATLAVVDPGSSTADSDVDTTTDAGSGGSGTGLVGGGPAGTAVMGAGAPDAARFTPGVGAVPMASGPTPRPTIYSRAAWGADEGMMTWDPTQGRVQGIDIHHTVNANDYSRSEVPGIIRGIYAYHAQDWGRGWGDIGYNFLVDRFGRIWEGRYGGVDAAPVGAHATGLNSNFSGISLIGNFETTAVPSAAFTSVAKLAAWKLWMHGQTTAYGSVTVDAGTFNRINGHRDSKSTTCPGRYMYDRLPEMRSRINSYIGTFGDRVLDRDLDGYGFPDLVMRTPTGVSIVPSVDRASFNRAQIGTGWNRRLTVSAGDLDADGDPDLLLIATDGTMWFYPADSAGRVSGATRVKIGSGWGSFPEVTGGVDWTGDRRPDLLAKRSDGTLWIYPGANGRYGRPFKIGASGWGGMSEVTMVPSFDAGQPAVLARQTSTGLLFAYLRSSSGVLSGRITLGPGWGERLTITGIPDATGDGIGDLVSTDRQGLMWLYPGTGAARLSSSKRQPIGTGGWQSTTAVLPHPTGGGELDFNAVRSDGSLWDYRVDIIGKAYRTAFPTGIALASSDRSVFAAGDWDGDGRADIMVIKSDGRLMLHSGLGGGRFSRTGEHVGSGWAGFRQVVAVGNWRGDGRPGLIAYDQGRGQLFFYPGNGSGGFRPRIVVSYGADGMDMLAYAGRFSGAGVSDLLMRGADSKRLFLYEGNGPGLAMPPVINGNGWGMFTNIVGVNDANHDGRADIITLTSGGQIRIYPGNGSGGFGSYRTLATWPTNARLG